MDASPPSAPQITAPGNGQVVQQAPVFTWAAAQDAQTGIQYYEAVVDGALRVTTKETSVNAKGLHLSCGSHTLIVKARNWAEQLTPSATIAFQLLDTVAPTQPAVVAANSLRGGQTRVIRLSSSDAERGILQYVSRANGATLTTVAGVDRDVTYRNVALGSIAPASSRQGELPAAYAIDNDPARRPESESLDGQWIRLDLGGLFTLGLIGRAIEQASVSVSAPASLTVESVDWHGNRAMSSVFAY